VSVSFELGVHHLTSGIGGNIIPETGDVLINGTSVIHHPRTARLALGVCPQFTAIDSQLTVREHLMVYGRLKGLHGGGELERNVESLMRATTLDVYADRLASKLSGGNQRKLSLAIALLGELQSFLEKVSNSVLTIYFPRQSICNSHR
jgi:ATP-binding cassette, subfamily A (ABC1), member 3